MVSVSRHIARAIRFLGQFSFLASSSESDAQAHGITHERLQTPAHVALYALGYYDLPLAEVLSGPSGFAKLAARIHVDHGHDALEMFYLWYNYQTVSSLLTNYAANGIRDGTFIRSFFADVAEGIHELSLESGVSDHLAAAASALGLKKQISPARVRQGRGLFQETFTERLEASLGLNEFMRAGGSRAGSISYATVYRIAKLLGELKAESLMGVHIEIESHGDLRKGLELSIAFERIGISKALLTAASLARRAITSYAEQGLSTRVEGHAEIWSWIPSFLEIVYGGLSDEVFNAAYEGKAAQLFGEQSNLKVRGMAPDAARNFGVHAKKIATPPLKAIAGLVAVALQKRPRKAAMAGAIGAFTGARDRWFQKALPEDVMDGFGAGIAFKEAEFRTYWNPVDGTRIERFVSQFPHELRWLGEDLVDQIDFYGPNFFATALSALVTQGGWTGNGDASLCLLGGARKSAALMSYMLDRQLELPYREIKNVVSKDADSHSILFLDDYTLSGTQSIQIIGELLGISKKLPYKYAVPLDAAERARFLDRTIVFMFAIGTNAARFRLSAFLRAHNVKHKIVFGRSVPYLSEDGMEAIAKGNLLDAGDSISNSLQYLADPLFSPASRLRKPERWQQARDFCAEVGYSLLERRARAKNWTDARRHGSALGFSSTQARLVFAYNVPKSTLTLLWESGSYQQKPWIPLFPSRE